jgi:hypothetical protein
MCTEVSWAYEKYCGGDAPTVHRQIQIKRETWQRQLPLQEIYHGSYQQVVSVRMLPLVFHSPFSLYC